jgi:hypothetical protein
MWTGERGKLDGTLSKYENIHKSSHISQTKECLVDTGGDVRLMLIFILMKENTT